MTRDRHHAEHFVRDHAFVLGIDRIVLDPRISGENGIQQILLRRERDARPSGLRPSRSISSMSRESIFSFSAISTALRRGELILDPVMQIEDGARGAILKQPFLELWLRLLESEGLTCSIPVTRSRTTLPSLPDDRLAYLVHVEFERGVGYRGIGEVGSRDGAESMSLSDKFISLASAAKSVPDWIF